MVDWERFGDGTRARYRRVDDAEPSRLRPT
jgi:hypothetical protein